MQGSIVFMLINVKVMAIVLLSLRVIIKFYYALLKKRVFSFEDRIVPLRCMASIVSQNSL